MLEGRLGEFHLLDILQLLTAAAKTGSLRLERDGEGARIDVRAGRLLDVVVSHRAPAPTSSPPAVAAATPSTDEPERRVDDLVELLCWRVGRFRFEGPAEQPSPPETPHSDALLDEARQRLQEWPQLLARLGGADAVLTLASPANTETVTLTADRWHLVSLVDGRRAVDDVAARWGHGRFRAHRTLVGFLDAGLVAAVADAKPAPAVVDVTPVLEAPAGSASIGPLDMAAGPVAFDRAGPRGLRTRVRPERLNGSAEDDVEVDIAMIERLIHGVERL